MEASNEAALQPRIVPPQPVSMDHPGWMRPDAVEHWGKSMAKVLRHAGKRDVGDGQIRLQRLDGRAPGAPMSIPWLLANILPTPRYGQLNREQMDFVIASQHPAYQRLTYVQVGGLAVNLADPMQCVDCVPESSRSRARHDRFRPRQNITQRVGEER